jgi:hypothetical protein
MCECWVIFKRWVVCATCLLALWCQVLSVRRSTTMEKVKRGVHAWWTRSGEGHKWSLGPRDRGLMDRPWTASTLKHRQARMVVKMMLAKVKIAIGQSQGGRVRTWWLYGWGWLGQALTSWTRNSCYATPSEFGGFGLKTRSGGFVGFRPQNSGENLGAAHGINREAMSRRTNHEGLMAVQCLENKLDHFAPGS